MNATLGNTSLLPFNDNLFEMGLTTIPNIVSLSLRIPVSIYILQLIISKHLITSEFYPFNEVICEVFICLHDISGIVSQALTNTYWNNLKLFTLGFIIIGRPGLLILICMDRYLAVVKPVVFLRLKPLKYKLALSGIIWLWTLVFSLSRFFIGSSEFHKAVVAQIVVCCVVKLYCCISTLLVLKQPGPGDGTKQRVGMSNIKLKAFRILLLITISVIIMYIPVMLVSSLKDYMTKVDFLTAINVCYTLTAISGFVQAFLFLQRSGKLPFIKWP